MYSRVVVMGLTTAAAVAHAEVGRVQSLDTRAGRE